MDCGDNIFARVSVAIVVNVVALGGVMLLMAFAMISMFPAISINIVLCF